MSFVQAEEARQVVRFFQMQDASFILFQSRLTDGASFLAFRSMAQFIDGLKVFVDAFVKSRSRRNSVFFFFF